MLAPHQMPHIQRSNTGKKSKRTRKGAEMEGKKKSSVSSWLLVKLAGIYKQIITHQKRALHLILNILKLNNWLCSNRNLSPCVVSHGYIPAHALDSFHAVWNTHGVVNKRGLIHGRTHVSAVCLWSRPQRADVIRKQATEATEWLIPLTQRSFESIIMVSFIAVDPFGPGCVITC